MLIKDLHLTECEVRANNSAKFGLGGTDLNDESNDQSSTARQEQMLRLHGEICDINEVARILKFPSAQALQKAMKRSKSPIPLVKLPNRRGLFASTRTLARYLDTHFAEETDAPQLRRRAKR
jgi:hypothetical protein